MGLLILAVLFTIGNKDFFDTVAVQKAEGYEWREVGKTKASGVPAITLKSNGEEYIIWKLKKCQSRI